MKLVCDGLDLSDAVLKVVKAVSTKTTNPVLECIKLKAKEDYLLLSATDLELSIEKKIRADIKVEGEVLVTGRLFADFVKKLNREQIELNLSDGGQLIIGYIDSQGALTAMNAADFPELPKAGDSDSFTIQSKDFKDAVNKVIFSASTEDSRPVLKGCLLEVQGGKLTTVALDGYRLAMCKKEIISASADLKAIVPARTLSEMSRFISDDDVLLSVYIQKNHIMINIDSMTVFSRLLDGEFINYKLIIPQEYSSSVIIEKAHFEDSLERASILSKADKNNLIKFDVREKVMLITSNSEAGNIKENLSVKLDGKDILIAFNARYLTDAVKNIADQYICINFTSAVSPCIIVPTDSEEFLYLILPVRIIN